MLAFFSMAVSFAAEDAEYHNNLQPTSRALKSCRLNPHTFTVKESKTGTNTVINPAWSCIVMETGDIMLTAAAPIQQLEIPASIQNCEQGPITIDITINVTPYTQITQNSFMCVITSTGTIYFLGK